MEKEQIRLFFTEQIRNEFLRNRENKIEDAIKRLKGQSLNISYPQLCKDYEEYSKLRTLQKEYEKNHSLLIQKIHRDVNSNQLKADMTINSIMAAAKEIALDKNIIFKAKTRTELGNPPGKSGSLGDAINWEILLTHAPKREDLYFISEDADYSSKLNEDAFKEFLLKEWGKAKSSNIFYYKRLSNFFKDKFPVIKLASEMERALLIRDLVSSPSFAATHLAISRLTKYMNELTPAQINEIVEAAIYNDQIAWIITDTDVAQFLISITSGHEKELDERNLSKLNRLLKPFKDANETFEDDIPF